MKKIVLILAVASVSTAVFAASTGTTQLQTVTGSGAATSNGDYISASAALDTVYRYFVEVPPGLPRLDVDIFDADIGLGGAAEATAGRDRLRTTATTATYSLIGPDGIARRTLFTTGNATTPAGSDNAWTSFFTSTGDTVRDTFTTVAYNNNDGTVNWAGNWIETNDNNSATNGNILITGGQLRIRDDGNANPSTIEREANLSGWTAATFTFDFSTQNVEVGDQMRVQVSNNGGASWTTLETFTGAFAASSRSYDITGFIAANTRVRFIEVGTGYTGTDSFFVDNVQIKDSVIRNGHWEIRVDESSASTTGDAINAIGLRAHDGTSGAGGTELNVYADSFVGLGVNPPNTGTTSRSYTLHPYITSGCTCATNDFDFDSNSGNVGSMVYTSRTAAFTQTIPSASLSGATVWARNSIAGWTSDTNSTEYGIWQLDTTINSYLVGGTPNGNYTAVWDSTFAAAANPPTANPQTNALRIYLPTDAGTAPVKPYLEQILTKRGSGVLAVGVPTRYTITVRLVNPTSNAITFSASHLVTANVPGGGVVYGGNAQAGQGIIVSQPSVGGTGNITWNPATLAAGATSVLAYDVLVTATSAGQRIPVTATPASGNGTRATYVDETGNTTQTRALYTFGPLCELAATQGLLTEVLLSSFEVRAHGSSAVVTWETASEAGTIGFNLYRVDPTTGDLTPANDTLLTANAGAPQGGRYRFVDVHVKDANPSYMLEELTADGRTLQYGPFLATSDGDDSIDGDVYEHEPHSGSAHVGKPAHGKKQKPDAAMVGVRHRGLTRISAADLAATLAMPEPAVRAAIGTGRISITDRGADVAWIGEAGNASLVFFGQESDSIFSNARMYRVSLDRGTPMKSARVTGAPEQATTFVATQQFEKDTMVVTVLPLDPDSDYWFWDFISSGNPTNGKKSFVIDVPAVATADGASLELRFQGALVQNTHHARVSLNGTRIGDVVWSALDASSSQLAIPAGVLNDGANTITIEGVLENGARSDLFYIDGFAMRYTRFARAVDGVLEMTATPGSTVTATGIGNGLALDITNSRQPVLLTGGGTSFVVPQNVTSLAFADVSTIAAPDSMRATAGASLRDRKNRADYLVIANASVREAADALAQLRSRDGLVTFVADVDDIYDEFSGGNVTPYAIRDFLAATRSWARPPRYIVLAGIGTLDYRNLTVGPGLIPPFLTKTPSGLFAADSLFSDFDGDGLPDIAIGRIPAGTNAELLAYVAKLDASERAVNGTPVFSADAFDRAANFKSESSLVEAPLTGRPVSHVYVDDLGAAVARGSLLAAWRTGSPLVSWIGHGGLDRISKASLLTVGDAASLVSTSSQLPVFVAMTCNINRFELGSFQSLGTALTIAPNAGSLAVWSASGVSSYRDATQLEQTFIRLATTADAVRIGDLIVQSLGANKSIGDTASVYLLLGDPAIPLSLPGPTPAVGQPTGDPE